MLTQALKRQIPRAARTQSTLFSAPAARFMATEVAPRIAPTQPEESNFVNYCFNLFDLNGNGVIELWEINAIYESGANCCKTFFT